jgi:SAM-dependent methyltransferase
MDDADQSVYAGDGFKLPLPQRQEMENVARVLDAAPITNKACLEIGFNTPAAQRQLRRLGGYWTAVARDARRQKIGAAALGETVECLGTHGELPFEDKQFDWAVMALGVLTGNAATDEPLIREVHRVTKVGGMIVLTVDHAKPMGLANLIARRRAPATACGCYTESDLFDLLKDGFDVLGIRRFCRFWTQLVRQGCERSGHSAGAPAGNGVHLLYGIAQLLDLPLVLTTGYLMTAWGRRKGWRPRQIPVLSDGRRISDAVLRTGAR